MSDYIISDKSVEEFKKIYKKDYGVELDNEEAFGLAQRFFNMMRVVCKPIPKERDKKTGG